MDRLTRRDLIDGYRRHEKTADRWMVGGEFERALLNERGIPVPYFGERGISWFLGEFMRRHGWKAKYEAGNCIELKGEPLAPAPAHPFLTLEPGSQVELSGAPYTRLADLAAEIRLNRAQIMEIVEGTGGTWTSCGLTPWAKIADIPFVPKGRYEVMQVYLPAQGPRAHWMMKGTCAVQVTCDFGDEADCARKFHLITDLAPLTVAMFANSPVAEGAPSGWMSTRAWVWTQTDNARTGFPLHRSFSYEGWVDWLLDSPMMFYMRGGRWTPAHGRTFRAWMADGIDGQFPGPADWELHQTSVFPEARVKNAIEIRSADAVSAPLSIAFCAYWKGLLYARPALDAARAVADRLTAGGTHAGRHLEAARSGLAARFGEGAGPGVGIVSAAELARELVDLAREGLRSLGEPTDLLDPLAEQVASGRSPAHAFLEAWERDSSPANILPQIAW